jgi:two-component system OmpR family response regulator
VADGALRLAVTRERRVEKFRHILIAEDDGDVREVLSLILDELGYRVSLAENSVAARLSLDRLDVDLLIADEIMSGENGRQLADYAKSLGIPTLMMSADNEITRELAELRQDFISKPFRLQNFRAEVERVLAKPRDDADGS